MSTRAASQNFGVSRKTSLTRAEAATPITSTKTEAPPAPTPTAAQVSNSCNAGNPSTGCNIRGDSNRAATMHAVKIKKELPSDEIKEFAENTMNELLGWYGFDGVDRMDLSAKTTRLLQSAVAGATLNNSTNNNNNTNNNVISSRHVMEKRRSRSCRAASLLQLQQQQHERQHQGDPMRSIINNNNNGNSTHNNNNKIYGNNNNSSRKGAISSYRNRNSLDSISTTAAGGGIGGGGDSTTSDHDTRSSREEDSTSPPTKNAATRVTNAATPMDEKADNQNCCWCRRPVPENGPEFLTTSDGPRYCSETCFSQSRRASFKKAKTCDWCKHVRHAISYVDFQDGASQLQFCSDKCLNQYKMQIFCKETQAHLDMNPHLREQGLVAAAASNGAGLITPDLWLRNCRSRSASPASTISVSPGPPSTVIVANNSVITTCSSSSPNSSAGTTVGGSAAATHKPMISVAPVSKLMSKSPSMLSVTSATSPGACAPNRQSPKHNRRKRTLRCSSTAAEMNSAMKNNHGVHMRSDISAAVDIVDKYKSLLSVKGTNNLRASPGHMVVSPGGGAISNAKQSTANALSQFAGSSVQDLHMSVPPLSPMLEQQSAPHLLPPHLVNAGTRGQTSIPPAYFATPNRGQPPASNAGRPHPQQLPPGAFPPHPPPFMPNAAGLLPRFLGGGGFGGLQQPPAPPSYAPHMLQAPPELLGGGVGLGGIGGIGALWGATPPVTVMVPYPIVIPLPIPIPVPLPVMDFYKAYLTPEERAQLKQKEEAQRDAKQRVTSASDIEEQPTTAMAAAMDTNGERKLEVIQDSERNELKEAHEEPLDFTKTKEYDVQHNRDQEKDYARSITNESFKLENAEEERLELPTSPVAASTTISAGNTPTTATVTPLSTPTRTPTPEAPSPPRLVEIPEQPQSTVDEEETHSSCTSSATPSAGDVSAAVTISEGGDEAKQKLPKFKITRLQTKRILIQTKDSASAAAAVAERSRPLRKRKRIIDCDFQKIALKEADVDESSDALAEPIDVEAAISATALTNTSTSNAKAYSKKL